MNLKKVTMRPGLTKGELMKLAYDNDETKLANVDVALPQEYVNRYKIETYWHVMDYNTNRIFGDVRNLRDVALENGIELV